MKRDMDLARSILLALEEHEHGYAPQHIQIGGYTDEQIAYHCYLLCDAGLIDAIDTTTLGSTSPEAIPKTLTWKGHEFVENAKNRSIWDQTKAVITDKVGNASFSVWTDVLAQLVTKNLGL